MNDRKYILLTGATGSIGREIASALYARGESLLLACRSQDKADKLIAELRKRALPGSVRPDLRFVPLDLEDDKSVTEAASAMRTVRLKAIINNAGVMNRHYSTAPNGLERTMAVNYVHTVMLNELLKDRVEQGGVIVFTTSLTRFMWRPDADTRHNLREGVVKGRELEVNERNFSQLGTYGLSKRMLTDYAAALSVRLRNRGVRVNCADPGVVNTGMITMHRWYDRLADILFRPFIRSPRHGAIPALRACESPLSGRIFCRRRTRAV